MDRKRCERVNKTESIPCAATADHRLLWMHPVLDDNGHVARLMTRAILLESANTGAARSIARRWGRNVEAYRQHRLACDPRRRNDSEALSRGTPPPEAPFARATIASV